MPKIRSGSSRYILIFLIIVSGVSLVSFTTFEIIKSLNILKIDRISIEGISDELNADLLEHLDPIISQNIFKFKITEAEDSLASKFAAIKQVDVLRKLPDEVLIRYNLKEPFVIISFNNKKFFYCDKDLRIIEEINNGYLHKSVPIVFSKISHNDYGIGEVVTDSISVALKQYYELMLAADPKFKKNISELFMRGKHCLIREITTGSVLNFGTNKLAYKIDLFNKYASSYCDGLYIDFTYKDRITTRKDKI